MYAAIYAYGFENGRRKHLGNVANIEHTTVLRTFDLSTSEVKGKCNFNLDNPLLYVINDERGRQKFAGFIKKPKKEERTELLTFAGEDFKKILDTDVLLDFSNIATNDFTLQAIFQKVADQITSTKDPFITMLDLEFIIPVDTTDTKAIADYTGQYLIVNAMKFLKVYLAYYGYFIKPSYNAALDRVTFEFKKMSNQTTAIKLKDFQHEKTSSDIKVNKAIATISYKTITEDASWIDSTQAYYDSQQFSNRATILGTELPAPDGYTVGFAIRLVSSHTYQLSNHAEYDAASLKSNISIMQFEVNVCYTAPSFEIAKSAAGDASQRAEGTVVRVVYKTTAGEICYDYPTFIKVVPSSVTYHQRSDVTYKPRPNLPEKVYTLGNDNQIYEGYAPEDKRIYPIVSKVFEASYLSEAQLNAVYEIVNNRYVENIIITQDNMIAPLDLESLELYTPIRVYDNDGTYKDIPISEKTYVHRLNEQHTDIKVGFKKTSLIEIIKNDVGQSEVVKSAGGGSGSNTVIEQFEIYEGETAPDPKDYNTWFKPISGEEMMMSMTTESGDLLVTEDTTSQELEVEGPNPYESS